MSVNLDFKFGDIYLLKKAELKKYDVNLKDFIFFVKYIKQSTPLSFDYISQHKNQIGDLTFRDMLGLESNLIPMTISKLKRWDSLYTNNEFGHSHFLHEYLPPMDAKIKTLNLTSYLSLLLVKSILKNGQFIFIDNIEVEENHKFNKSIYDFIDHEKKRSKKKILMASKQDLLWKNLINKTIIYDQNEFKSHEDSNNAKNIIYLEDIIPRAS